MICPICNIKMKSNNGTYFSCYGCAAEVGFLESNFSKIETYFVPLHGWLLSGWIDDFFSFETCIVHPTDYVEKNGDISRKLLAHSNQYFEPKDWTLPSLQEIYDKLIKLEKLKNFK